MNVPVFSVAPAASSAAPASSGVVSAPDGGAPDSFASAMQVLQTRDAARKTPSSKAEEQPPAASAGTGSAASPGGPLVTKVFTTPTVPTPKALVAPLQAGSVHVASDRAASVQAATFPIAPVPKEIPAPGSRAAVQDAPTTQAQEEVTSSQQSFTPVLKVASAKAAPQSAEQADASQEGGDLPQPGAAAMEPTLAAASTFAPDPADGKPEAKATAGDSSRAAKKAFSTPELSRKSPIQAPAPQPATVPLQRKPEIAIAVQVMPQQDPAGPAEHDAGMATAAVNLPKNLPAILSAADPAGARVKSASTVPGPGENASTAQVADAASAGTQPFGPHVFAPVGSTAAQISAPQVSPLEERSSAATPAAGDPALPAMAAAASQPAAVFAPSLMIQPASIGEHHVSSDLSGKSAVSAAAIPPDGAAAPAAPVRRLEITVQDPVLGNMDVRAEMRGSALHASLTGTQENGAASMPALHLFLQQHDVAVHTLTYATARDGVAATGLTSSGSTDMGRDTAGRSFSGSPSMGSQQQGNGGSQPQGQRYGSPGTPGEDVPSRAAYLPQLPGSPEATAFGSQTLPAGSTLSIHI